MRAPVLLSLLVACGGDDGTGTQTALACDDITTQPLTSVNANDYPYPDETRALTERLAAFEGLWEAEDNSCGESTNVKIEVGNATNFDLVLEPWPQSLECGCTVDPEFPSDSKLEAVAVYPDPPGVLDLAMSIVIPEWPDPGVQNNNISEGGIVTAFSNDEQIVMRGCITEELELDLGSAYTTYSAVIRNAGSGIEVDLVLTPADGGEVEVCQLRGFTLIER